MAQFSLKWKNHVSNMLTTMENLKVVESFVDVTLACELHTIKAHKLVLSTGSSFFHQLFLANPSQHPIVVLHNIKYHNLKRIIDFLYKGEINIPSAEMEELLKTAETLDIKGLPDICKERLNSQKLDARETHSENSLDITPLESTPRKRKRGRQSCGSAVIFDKVVPKMETCTSPISSEYVEFHPQISETRTLGVDDSSMDSLPTCDGSLMVTTTAVQTKKKDETIACEVEPFRTIENNQTEQENKSVSYQTTKGCHHLDFEREVFRSLEVLRSAVDKNSQLLGAMQSNTNNSLAMILPKSCPKLPANYPEALTELEVFLEESKNFQVICDYFSKIGGVTMKDCTRRILQGLLSNQLSTRYNWLGSGGIKLPFRSLNQINLLITRSVRRHQRFESETDSAIQDVIKKWLMHSKDRDGGRMRRVRAVSPENS